MGRRFVAVAVLALVASGCGGGNDSDEIKNLYDSLVSAAEGSAYSDFCDRATSDFEAAVRYTGDAPTCTEGLQSTSSYLPKGRLTKLTVNGDRASGEFRDATGRTGRIKFAKEDGDWKVDGLTNIASEPSPTTEEPTTPEPVDPGKLHTAEGREIATVVGRFYDGLVNQDTAEICANVTPSVQRKVKAIGSIQGAKTCAKSYEAVLNQISFKYDTVPEVVRVTISGRKARATSTVGADELKAPLRKIGGEWKVNTVG